MQLSGALISQFAGRHDDVESVISERQWLLLNILLHGNLAVVDDRLVKQIVTSRRDLFRVVQQQNNL